MLDAAEKTYRLGDGVLRPNFPGDIDGPRAIGYEAKVRSFGGGNYHLEKADMLESPRCERRVSVSAAMRQAGVEAFGRCRLSLGDRFGGQEPPEIAAMVAKIYSAMELTRQGRVVPRTDRKSQRGRATQ